MEVIACWLCAHGRYVARSVLMHYTYGHMCTRRICVFAQLFDEAHSFCLVFVLYCHYITLLNIQDATILKALDERYATVSSLGPQHDQDEEKEKVCQTTHAHTNIQLTQCF
jgi:hypothetical protein